MADVYDRSFGLTRDTVAGGSDYDAIAALPGGAAGIIPAPTEFWPVTGGTFNENIDRDPRDNEIRGYPEAPPPLPWTARPEFTIPVPPYFDIVARVMQQAFGSNPTRTGAAPAALTDTLKPLPLRTAVLAPRFHVALVRDALTYRASGCVINSFNLTLPMGAGDGSLEVGFMGLFYQQRPSSETPPTPAFNLPVRKLRVADVKAYLDGSLTSAPDVTEIGFQYGQDYEAKPYAGRNRVPDPASPCQYVHFPAELRRKPNRTVSPRITFGKTQEAEEFKKDFSRAQATVIEIEECPIATTPAAVRMIRLTFPKAVWTDGGADALNRADDINTPLTGTAGYDEVSGFAVKAEVVHNTPTLFTA